MSLLGTPVYANASTPIWLSAGGDTIQGNLTVNGTLDVSGNADFQSPQVSVAGQLSLQGPNAKMSFQETGVGTGMTLLSDTGQVNGFIETNGTLYLGRLVAGNTANTTFTPSAPTTNGDVLTVGGRIGTAAGGGITPIASSVPNTVIPFGGSTPLSPVPALPTLPTTWYDVQLTGLWSLPGSFTPAADDVADVTVAVEAGGPPQQYWSWTLQDRQYPSIQWSPGGYSEVNLRGRVLSGPSGLPSVSISVFFGGSGTYPVGQTSFEVLSVSLVRLS